MKPKKWLGAIVGVVALGVGLTGCGGGGTSPSSTTTTAQSGQVFVSGTDAPLASVLSFQVDITGMTVSDGVNPPISVLNGTQTVDFARLNGLHTLLDINSIPAGTYSSVTMTFANPQISFMNVTNPQTTPPTRPTITTLNTTSSPAATLTQSSVTAPLASPLTVTANEVIGLSFDFDLKDSVAVDGNGQITGAVNPMVTLKAVTPDNDDAYIDDFVAGVVSTGSSSFLIQGPHGHQFTVNVNDQTEWENNESISNLTSTSIVEVSGTLDRTSGAILADTIAIVSQDKFWAGGLITYVDPTSGAANDFDLYVRSVLPTGTGFTSGQISTIDLSGNENYFIYFWHNKFTNLLFNSSLMVPGQHISIAGPLSNGAVTVKRVVLRAEGHTGSWVVGSTNTGAGTFQFNSNGVAGVLFNGPITVYCTPFTKFKGGLTGLGSITGTTALNLRVVGLVLRDPISGQAVFVAHSVEQMSN
ncbi:MAG: DUF4382 domain-containing protein [Acidobacteria bacterium]|nr:DUF4382 domain-containing protein [Acidobacteriota bacterium]